MEESRVTSPTHITIEHKPSPVHDVATSDDVTLVCMQGEFPVHRLVLSEASPYFRSMFTSDWVEAKSGRVHLPTVTGEAMEVILGYIYEGKIPPDLKGNKTLLQELLAASHLLQLDVLVEICFSMLADLLRDSYYCGLYELCMMYNNEGLIKKIVSFWALNFKGLIHQKDQFLNFDKNQLKEILQHPELDKDSMDDIVEGIIDWAEFTTKDYEMELRAGDILLDLMSVLDLRYLSSQSLTTLIRNKELVKRNQHVVTLLTAEATSRTLNGSTSGQKLLCLGLKDHEQGWLKIYNIETNDWSMVKALPFRILHGMAIAAYGSHVYFIGGGEKYRKPGKRIIKYCPHTNAVISIQSLNCPVVGAGAGVAYDAIYVVGGWKWRWRWQFLCKGGLNFGKRISRSVHRFIPSTGACQEVASTNESFDGPHVFHVNDALYIIGSYHIKGSIVERYDPLNDHWTVITGRIPSLYWYESSSLCETKFFPAETLATIISVIFNPNSKPDGHPSNAGTPVDSDGEPRHRLTIEYGGKDITYLWGVWLSQRRPGSPILLVRDHHNILHSYDILSNKWIASSEPNNDVWGNALTCIC